MAAGVGEVAGTALVIGLLVSEGVVGEGDLNPGVPTSCNAGVDDGVTTGDAAGALGLAGGRVPTGVLAVVGAVVAAAVARGVGATLAVGVAADVLIGVPVYGDGTGVVGETVAADVAAGVSSSGTGGKGMVGVGTSLAWLVGGGEAVLTGVTAGVPAGVVAYGTGAAVLKGMVAPDVGAGVC